MLSEILSFLSDGISAGSSYSWIFILIALFAFVLIALKAVKMLIKTLLAGIIAGLFPFIINNVLGITGMVELSLSTSLKLMILGMIFYLIYSAVMIMVDASVFTGKIILIPVNILIFTGNAAIWLVKSILYLILNLFGIKRKEDEDDKSKKKGSIDIKKTEEKEEDYE